MDFLTITWYHNSVEEWLIAAGAFIAAYILMRFIRWLFVRKFSALAHRTATDIDDFIVALLRGTRWFFIIAVSLEIAIQFLKLPDTVVGIIDRIVLFTVLLQVALWGNQLIAYLLKKYVHMQPGEEDAARTSTGVLNVIGKMILWVVVLLFMLDNLGVDITALVTGLGIGGIAVALALQNILGDLFASLSIMLDKPFIVGDFMRLDTYAGTVQHIGLKTTRLRSLSGEQLIISNTDLLSARIQNYKRMEERRIPFTIGVVYQTSYEKVSRIPGMIREILESEEQTRFDRAHFKEFGAYALIFEVVYFVLSPDYLVYMDIQERINLKIYEAFEKEGIVMAYPTQTLFVEKEESAS